MKYCPPTWTTRSAGRGPPLMVMFMSIDPSGFPPPLSARAFSEPVTLCAAQYSAKACSEPYTAFAASVSLFQLADVPILPVSKKSRRKVPTLE